MVDITKITRYLIVRSEALLASIRNQNKNYPLMYYLGIQQYVPYVQLRPDLAAVVELNNYLMPVNDNSIIPTLDTTMLGVFIQDIEHMQGTAVSYTLRILSSNVLQGVHLIFYTIFSEFIYENFGNFFGSSADYRLITNIFFFTNVLLDLDMVMELMKMFFSETHHKVTPKLYKALADTFSYLQIYSAKYCNLAGYSFRASGKFSRHLSVQATTYAVRGGRTSGSLATCGAIYRYGQGSNASGAYGIHLCYYTKNLIKLNESPMPKSSAI
eukprot:TRINITY_DN414_c0_g1_i15.p1 TRINITY_DN414_c0_g1~~TRINITY_DN414_c0_g1_i15.p1  ORF type:complete len:270 (-),score=-62.91 TRINITY_DN414_c0_g1_i15:79-888(-)